MAIWQLEPHSQTSNKIFLYIQFAAPWKRDDSQASSPLRFLAQFDGFIFHQAIIQTLRQYNYSQILFTTWTLVSIIFKKEKKGVRICWGVFLSTGFPILAMGKIMFPIRWIKTNRSIEIQITSHHMGGRKTLPLWIWTLVFLPYGLDSLKNRRPDLHIRGPSYLA